MLAFTVIRRIEAPPDAVFRAFADFENAGRRIEAIERVEMRTNGPVRAGTRFVEHRRQHGGRHRLEMEITRFEPGEGYALRCESHGCVFTSAVLVVLDGIGASKVEVALQIEPRTLVARVKARLALPQIQKDLEREIDDMKRAIESEVRAAR